MTREGSASVAEIRAIVLAAAGLRDLFAAIVPIDDVQRGKPDPEGFQRALAALNAARQVDTWIAPWACVAVEDATDGALAARAAGMRVVAIRGPGYDPDCGAADLIIDRLDVAALEAILGLGSGR